VKKIKSEVKKKAPLKDRVAPSRAVKKTRLGASTWKGMEKEQERKTKERGGQKKVERREFELCQPKKERQKKTHGCRRRGKKAEFGSESSVWAVKGSGCQGTGKKHEETPGDTT